MTISQPKVELNRDADSLELEQLLLNENAINDDSKVLECGNLKEAGLCNDPTSQFTARRTPIPWVQVCFVAIWRMSQAMFFIVILPYLNAMLVEMGEATEVTVGKKSGLVEAAAAIGVVGGVFVFAPLSDRYGRKWVTIIGVFVASLLCVAFGFARTFPQLLFLRFAMGFFNGAQASTAKVILSELCDKSNEALSFAIMGTGWQIGATAAPLLGAALAHPAKTWPSMFKGTIFETYSYALPPFVAAVVPGVASIFAICFAEESHPDIRAGRKKAGYGKVPDSPLTPMTPMDQPSFESEQDDPPMFSCGAAFAFLVRGLLIMTALWNGATELLLFFSSKAIGGLALTQAQMSLFLAVRPLLVCVFTLFFSPWLFRTYTCIQILKVTMWFVPLYGVIYLALASLAGVGLANRAVIVLALSLVLIVQTLSNPAYLCTNVIINARAPTARQLSKMNAWCEVMNQFCLGSGAALGSAVFAWSNEHHILPGKLSWIIFVVLSIGMAVISQKLTHVDGWRERQEKMEQSYH